MTWGGFRLVDLKHAVFAEGELCLLKDIRLFAEQLNVLVHIIEQVSTAITKYGTSLFHLLQNFTRKSCD